MNDGTGHVPARPSRLLIVEIAGEAFAIDAGGVREVVCPSPLTRSARLPACVLGLATLRGEPFPVLDLAHLIGKQPVPLDANGCFILQRSANAEPLLAFAANRIIGTERIANQQILPVPSAGAGLPAARLLGVASLDGRMTPILDLQALLAMQDVELSGYATPVGIVSNQGAVEQRQARRRRKVLILGAGDARVAVETAELARVAPRPHPAEDVGPQTVTVDGRELALLDANRLLGTGSTQLNANRGVVVIGRSDDCVAIGFDAVDSFVELEESTDGSGHGAAATLRRGLIETEGGVVELVSLSALVAQGAAEREKLVATNAVKRIAFEQDAKRATHAAAERAARAAPWLHLAGSVLLVRIGTRTFALPGHAVVEVLPTQPLLPAPGRPDGVIGLLELRGAVYAAVDVASRLDIARGAAEDQPNACLVMLRNVGGQSGLFVDAVLEWRRIDASELGATENVGLVAHPDLFLASITLDSGTTVPLLAVDRLLGDTRQPLRNELRSMGAVLPPSAA